MPRKGPYNICLTPEEARELADRKKYVAVFMNRCTKFLKRGCSRQNVHICSAKIYPY